MKALTPALFVLITIRLMVPPGVCICQASSPVLHVLARATGYPPPPTEDHHDHDHHPGCPCSGLSEGMGLKPASPGIDPPQPSIAAALPQPQSALPGQLIPATFLAFSITPPLFLSACVLLI